MMNKSADRRDLPGYSLVQAAGYLLLPVSTVRAWALGQAYRTSSGRRFARPLIHVAQEQPPVLSFWNLVELYILGSIRRHHRVPMQNIRPALNFLKTSDQFKLSRPLLQQELLTDGLSLFVDRLSHLINVSQAGQGAFRDLLQGALQRIERDTSGLPRKLFPWRASCTEPKSVEIDPATSFGRMVVAGTGVQVRVLAERFEAGESVAQLADDYHLNIPQVEDALRWDLRSAA